MSVKSKEEWAFEWIERINDNREELKKYIKYVYSIACCFESGDFDCHSVLIMYDGSPLIRLGFSDILEEHGLALVVYSEWQFDCTNGEGFNFLDYLTSEENYLFKVWCEVTGKEYTWAELKEWSPEVYKRVGRQHRLALLEKFDPDVEIDKTLNWLKNKGWLTSKTIPTTVIILGPDKDAPKKPDPVPQEGLTAFWNIFRMHSGDWYLYLCHPGTGELAEWWGYEMALEILLSFRYCYDTVPLKYRIMVYNWLERDDLWDQKTRDKVLEGCTYSELSFILGNPLLYSFLRRYNEDKFQAHFTVDPIDEEEPLSPKVSEDIENNHGKTLDDDTKKDVPF